MNVITTIKEGLSLSRDWRALAAAWKDRNFTALGSAIGVLIVALVHFARSQGYALPFDVDPDTANRIGMGVAAVCSLLHAGAPAAAGPAAAAVAGSPGDAAAGEVAHAAAPVGSGAAKPPAADPVRAERTQATGPTGDFMP